MRLIDADMLKEHYSWWGDDNERKKLFDTIIDLQPTVVVEDSAKGGQENVGSELVWSSRSR